MTWVKWTMGFIPCVDKSHRLDVLFSDGTTIDNVPAGSINWQHETIIAYRLKHY